MQESMESMIKKKLTFRLKYFKKTNEIKHTIMWKNCISYKTYIGTNMYTQQGGKQLILSIISIINKIFM